MIVSLEHVSTLPEEYFTFNSYSFYIKGISRACLQELARHRVASLSVKSTRYTLKELRKLKKAFAIEENVGYSYNYDLALKYVVLTNHELVDKAIIEQLESLRQLLIDGVSNDIAKYAIPEAYKTELMWTIDYDGLQNFFDLRSSKSALKEIRDLSSSIYRVLPKEHQSNFILHSVQSNDE